jgi:hypothetical protein
VTWTVDGQWVEEIRKFLTLLQSVGVVTDLTILSPGEDCMKERRNSDG